VDLETMYVQHVKKNFDLDLINNSNVLVAYDAMYGAGQNVIPQVLKNPILLHCDYNPSFKGQAPETARPQTYRNLHP
jgi:phosphomannomutase